MDLNVLLLGRHEYGETLRIQNELLEKRQRGEIGDTLILVEHDPVITLGKNAEKSNITASEECLKDNGISVHSINRGGDVTYHGYGQIVGYPIINLRLKEMGVKKFVDTIEELFIRLLGEKHSIAAGRDEHHTGVWVKGDKIVAIGLAVKRHVTMHGFAYNVSTNLEHFNYIVPCGIKDKGVTSLQKLSGKEFPDVGAECESIIRYFCSLFSYENCRMVELEEILNQGVSI
ncbi:MAG: lipB [Firmicutes bacterium]|nr:lipB [Bacillota bacterium]